MPLPRSHSITFDSISFRVPLSTSLAFVPVPSLQARNKMLNALGHAARVRRPGMNYVVKRGMFLAYLTTVAPLCLNMIVQKFGRYRTRAVLVRTVYCEGFNRPTSALYRNVQVNNTMKRYLRIPSKHLAESLISCRYKRTNKKPSRFRDLQY